MKPSGKFIGIVLLAALIIAAAGGLYFLKPAWPPLQQGGGNGYVGVETCAQCHTEQHEDWLTSHHALAMAKPSAGPVLGDFENATFQYNDRRTEFKRNGDDYVVRTEDVAGAPQSYTVHATFGAYPLQQYLVETGDGWIQTLPYTWDSRPETEGGQRWYHLYENEDIDATDPLHWTKRQQNWNQMCASCHSTNLIRNFDDENQSYATTYTDINVGCESCHGPGQAHTSFRRQHSGKAARYEDIAQDLLAHLGTQTGGRWQRRDDQPVARLDNPAHRQDEIQVCAACHSRRAALTEEWNPRAPFLDQFIPALLDRDLYFDDGQIMEEVFEYGSFLQSKMYRAGVTCNDCHNPHTGKTREKGNQLCTTCHQPEAFDTPDHYHHQTGTEAAQCVNCHMPERTYMGVDARRDHSFRVPRPDLTQSIGTPNACATCHRDKTDEWATNAIEDWRSRPVAQPHYGLLLHELRLGAPGAAAKAATALDKSADLPDIVKATLAAELASHPAAARESNALATASQSTDPLIRLGAVRGLDPMTDASAKARILAPLLDDPYKSIRVEAGRALAGPAEQYLDAEQRERLQSALNELNQVAADNPDRPENIFTLGNVHLARREWGKAIAAYRHALALDPLLPPVYVNLSEALRNAGQEAEATAVLEAGLQKLPETAVLHHAYGLALIRDSNHAKAMRHLRKAVMLSPGDARFAYVLGVAQYSNGQKRLAISTLEDALEQAPYDPGILQAMVSYLEEMGQYEQAAQYRKALGLVDKVFDP